MWMWIEQSLLNTNQIKKALSQSFNHNSHLAHLLFLKHFCFYYKDRQTDNTHTHRWTQSLIELIESVQDWYFTDVYILTTLREYPPSVMIYDIRLGYISYLNYPKSWIDVLIQKHLLCIKHRKSRKSRAFKYRLV